MRLAQILRRPPWRTIVPGCELLLAVWIGYALWNPGLDVRDGRHDLGHNGTWLGHGWLGGDDWFIQNAKTNEFARFRDPARIHALAEQLRQHHTTDVFPHLCPAEPDGRLPSVDAEQIPKNYQAVAIYCEWETSETEWQHFREHFLNPTQPGR